MTPSVETELDFARQSSALGVWSLLYFSHPDFFLAEVSTGWAKTPGQALQIIGLVQLQTPVEQSNIKTEQSG
jgi:hypothetical protein